MVQPIRRYRQPGQVIMNQPERISATERRPARGQFIQHRAQRVQISPLIHRPTGPPRGLRRQVRQRPGDHGLVGELRPDLRHRLRQREIHQAQRTIRGHTDHRPPSHKHPRHPGPCALMYDHGSHGLIATRRPRGRRIRHLHVHSGRRVSLAVVRTEEPPYRAGRQFRLRNESGRGCFRYQAREVGLGAR